MKFYSQYVSDQSGGKVITNLEDNYPHKKWDLRRSTTYNNVITMTLILIAYANMEGKNDAWRLTNGLELQK